MEQHTFIPEEFKDINLIPKAIIDNDPQKLKEKVDVFKRTHMVMDEKQRCSNVIILFYVDGK